MTIRSTSVFQGLETFGDLRFEALGNRRYRVAQLRDGAWLHRGTILSGAKTHHALLMAWRELHE